VCRGTSLEHSSLSRGTTVTWSRDLVLFAIVTYFFSSSLTVHWRPYFPLLKARLHLFWFIMRICLTSSRTISYTTRLQQIEEWNSGLSHVIQERERERWNESPYRWRHERSFTFNLRSTQHYYCLYSQWSAKHAACVTVERRICDHEDVGSTPNRVAVKVSCDYYLNGWLSTDR